jgi:hypothetical protein
MSGDYLRSVLHEFGMSQRDFSSLLDVTPRCVSLWLNGERKIPGPVIAYIRLFRMLPLKDKMAEVGGVKIKAQREALNRKLAGRVRPPIDYSEIGSPSLREDNN